MARLSFKLKGLEQMVDRAKRARSLIETSAAPRLRQVALAALWSLRARTPVYMGGGGGMTAKSWFIFESRWSAKGREGYMAIIDHPWNTVGAILPRTKRIVNDGKFNLLEALEYGTRPHVIRGKNQRYLKFRDSRSLDWVQVVSVFHGSKAFGMMRETEARATAEIAKIQVDLVKKIAELL